MVTALSVPGVLFVLLGLWQGYDALVMDVTITSAGQTVANFQAMQVQVMSLLIGCTLFVAGVLLTAASCIVHRLTPPPASA